MLMCVYCVQCFVYAGSVVKHKYKIKMLNFDLQIVYVRNIIVKA